MSLLLAPFLAGMLALPEATGSFVRDASFGSDHGTIVAEIFVDEEGKVLECMVRYSTIEPRIAERFCDRAIGKAAGTPGTSPDGQPVHGQTVVARHQGASRLKDPAVIAVINPTEIEIFVERLPGPDEQQKVNLLLYVESSGSVGACEFHEGEDADFAAVACEQVKSYVMPVRLDENGEPVDYVRPLAIAFVTQ